MVEYSATFTILKPADMSKATGVLVYQVPNRGRANIEGGGYFADFRAARPRAGGQRLAGRHPAPVPASRRWWRRWRSNRDGSSITGPVMARFYDAPPGATTQPIIRGRVTGTATPASLDTTKATLTRRTVGRGRARADRAPTRGRLPTARRRRFRASPTRTKLCLKDGFDPASLYELTYVAKDPPVHGIGFAATRDLIAFLRQPRRRPARSARRAATPSRRAPRSRATTCAAS